MPSSATLTTLGDRVEQLLLDTANAVFPTGLITEVVRLGLEEYTRARPLSAAGTLTGTAAREQALSSLTGLISIVRVWFPYTAATPEYPPAWVEWSVFDNAGTLTLFLDVSTAPTAAEVIRVFYGKLHALNGLDSATATTYSAADDGILVLLAAGYACASRAVDLNETAQNMAVSTPNYAALARMFFRQGREQLFNNSRGVQL